MSAHDGLRLAVHAPAEPFIIWGAGGHGRVVADLVRALGDTVVGFVDRDVSRVGQLAEPGGACVIATDAELDAVSPHIRLAVAIGDNATRLRCVLRRGERSAPPLVHPRAVCSPSVTLGVGSVVLAGAVINAAARIGTAGIINTASVVEHDCRLGDGVHLSPGAILCGGVRVSDRAWIGAGATVLPGVSIGADAMVGAGAVVLRDVAPGSTVVGNPARAIAPRA